MKTTRILPALVLGAILALPTATFAAGNGNGNANGHDEDRARGQAEERLADRGKVALCAEMCGGAQRVLDMSVEYAKVREQFGKPIGSFQAIKHRMADALMLVEMARSGLERTTWTVSENLAADASVAKAWASDAYKDVAAETVQLHGGVGFTWEHDAHLYVRRARYDDAFLGNATFQRERIATLLQW